jgi:hypothetical protein
MRSEPETLRAFRMRVADALEAWATELVAGAELVRRAAKALASDDQRTAGALLRGLPMGANARAMQLLGQYMAALNEEHGTHRTEN